VLTQPKSINDQNKGNEASEYDIQFVESSEDAAESFQPPE